MEPCKLGYSSQPARAPNIVFILADDLGFAGLGCYGQKKIRTPNVDRIAAEGIRFTQSYSGNAVCAPSRCCLMTGKHPGHAYIRDNREVKPEGQAPIPADTVTVAKLLKARGYATAAIGKWGLGGRSQPAGVRSVLRLQLPAPRPQLLSALPVAERPEGEPRWQRCRLDGGWHAVTRP
jgi:arylsulfatase A-like enzyme